MNPTSSSVAEGYRQAIRLFERGDLERARRDFEKLLERSGDPAIFFMLGRVHSELGQMDAAIARTLTAHQRSPTSDTLRNLARFYWLCGDEKAFENLLLEQVKCSRLGFVAVELCRQSGRHALALQMLAAMPEAMRNTLQFPLSAAWIYIETGDPTRALQCAELAYRASSDAAGCLQAYASALLMNGRYADARDLCQPVVHQSADSVTARALLLVAERLLGTVSEDHLRSLIVPTLLEAPEEFADMTTFNDTLRRDVAPFHCHQRHPVDQSLEGGSQTCRNLATCTVPAVQTYLGQCLAAAEAYMSSVEAYPGRQYGPAIPEIKRCWGVRLRPGGFHRSHIHPEGFLSAAYYLTTPETADGGPGAIRFGVPPFPLPDPLQPIVQITPTEGLLVLFPSYLWHGTVPTRADAGVEAVRETLPFDVTLAQRPVP